MPYHFVIQNHARNAAVVVQETECGVWLHLGRKSRVTHETKLVEAWFEKDRMEELYEALKQVLGK